MDSNLIFGEFMTDVMTRADNLSFEKCGRPLTDKYEAPSTILKMIGAVTNTGWNIFNQLYQLLSQKSYWSFSESLPLFMLNPVGNVILGSLVYWGGKSSLKLLYDNQNLVEVVKRIGDKYQPLFVKCSKDSLENLAEQAANDLVSIEL
ncbi:MAG: hypothetical protein ACI304_09720 [Lepagella sp.]